MTPDKIAQFASLLKSHYHPATGRGRKPTPFITEDDGGTWFPASRSAYILRLQHFKVLTAVDQGCPCIDPIGETKRQTGGVRRTLWLYLHECLPEYPGKAQGLADLLATHNANLLMQGIERVVLDQLTEGLISDSDYARSILDDERLMAFAARWFSRDNGRRGL